MKTILLEVLEMDNGEILFLGETICWRNSDTEKFMFEIEEKRVIKPIGK